MIAQRTAPLAPRWRVWAACLFLSMAPDLDVVPGILLGNLSAYHNHASHSPLFGLAFCLLAAWPLQRFLKLPTAPQAFALAAACYGLHLFMDWLTFGRGLLLLWPFSGERFASPLTLFYGVRHSEGLRSAKHLITLATEALLMAALYLGISASLRLRKNRP